MHVLEEEHDREASQCRDGEDERQDAGYDGIVGDGTGLEVRIHDEKHVPVVRDERARAR